MSGDDSHGMSRDGDLLCAPQTSESKESESRIPSTGEDDDNKKLPSCPQKRRKFLEAKRIKAKERRKWEKEYRTQERERVILICQENIDLRRQNEELRRRIRVYEEILQDQAATYLEPNHLSVASSRIDSTDHFRSLDCAQPFAMDTRTNVMPVTEIGSLNYLSTPPSGDHFSASDQRFQLRDFAPVEQLYGYGALSSRPLPHSIALNHGSESAFNSGTLYAIPELAAGMPLDVATTPFFADHATSQDSPRSTGDAFSANIYPRETASDQASNTENSFSERNSSRAELGNASATATSITTARRDLQRISEHIAVTEQPQTGRSAKDGDSRR